MNEREDITEIAPLLSSIEKRKVEVPEGFLESLEEKILREIQPKARVIAFKPSAFFYMAAGIALVMGLFWFLRPESNSPEQTVDLNALVSQLSIEEIDSFVMMDEYLIEEVYLEKTGTTTSPEIEYLIDDDVWSDELIIEYL
ncbi:MAG: hypothetical protein O2867_10110 [Bacteroidetes bacterium]|jgi:hypothetical protein|nr:hypothetical protein [Bacteroidota bacterium]